MEATVALIVAIGTLVLGLADKIRQSRCTHIECCGCIVDRKVIEKPESP